MNETIQAGSKPKSYEMLLNREQVPLPYHDYNESDGIYIMNDNGLSVIFECVPYGGGASEAGLITTLSSIPEGASIQFILYPSPDVTSIIDNWKDKRITSNEIFADTAADFCDFVESKTCEKVSGNMRTVISNYRLIVAVSLGSKEEIFSLFDNVGGVISNIMTGFNIKEKDKNVSIKKDTVKF